MRQCKSFQRVGSTLAAAVLGYACAGTPGVRPVGSDPAQAELLRHAPAKLLPPTDKQKQLEAAADLYFGSAATRRAYLMVDKPLYQPGETIWFRADLRQTRSLTGQPGQLGSTIQLVSPRGSVVLEKRVAVGGGVAANDFEIPVEAQGGEYIVRFTGDEGTTVERPIVVASYEAPRLKKDLELLRKAYGPGDAVSAAIEVARATGEPFAQKKLTAVAIVDDQEIARVDVTTDAQGKAIVKFKLPPEIARGDGLLTVMADDAGVTESIQKRIPIVLKAIDLAMYPEGGDLVQGLPGRVYVEAKTLIGKPADVAGRVVDDRGREVSTFETVHDGLGRFALKPEKGRSYHVEITKPEGVTKRFDVPAAQAKGCALQAIDDLESAREELTVAAFCTESRAVLVEAVLRERRLAGAAVEVAAGRPALVNLPVGRTEQGAVRVTLFADDAAPLAERLVYRGRRSDLRVSITADKKGYSPRDPVTLTVKTTDLAGKPVEASLGLSVVDDTVLSFADDEEGHLLASMYLLPELGGQKVEKPDFYFSDDPQAAASMDLLMGTKGWRRFEWQQIWGPAPGTTTTRGSGREWDMANVQQVPVEMAPPPAAAPPAPPDMAPGHEVGEGAAAQKPRPVLAREPQGQPAEEKQEVDDALRPEARGKRAARPVGGAHGGAAGPRVMDGELGDNDRWGGEDEANWEAWAPVRVFPAPTYQPGYDGPRTDFRETIFWTHEVKTDGSGTAKVTFYLSDAVTSFRAIAEGVSAGGLPGRGDMLVKSKLPMSLDVRLPLEVTSSDKLELPITLTNETERELTARLTTSFGKAFKTGEPGERHVTLAAGEKRSFFYPLSVVGNDGEGDVVIALESGGLRDEVKKAIRVVPLGFPFQLSLSGTAKGRMRHEVDLTGAMPGSIQATLQMYPSPLATMTAGAEALLREPGGCFEQTSAFNYPNILVMNYLQSNDAADAGLVARASGMMERGYKILTGYESPEKGYEWFGENPGHEALTAYGLMEFEDMSNVMEGVDRGMIERTAKWLMGRRDGKGGFERNARALDSFGRASYETTNGYIMWALSEAKRAKGLDKEIAVQRQAGLESKDPYLVALAANVFLNMDPAGNEARSMADRLAAMQGQDGRFAGARETITMSGGQGLEVETTSLALLALIKASPNGEHEPKIRAAVEWLNGQRGGWGEWANTQGTVLSLKAMTAYAEHSRQTQASGVASLFVNGKAAGKIAFEKGRREALVFDDLAGMLKPGRNVIEIQLDSEAALPYSVAIEYRSARPQSSPEAQVGLETSLAKKTVKLGEGVKMRAKITNRSAQGVPMTLARIGLPGGLTFQTWQLKELREKGVIGFYETRQREVILYFRALQPNQVVDVDLDLVTTVPGTYVAPASSTYLYYTDEHRTWTNPVEVTVTR